MPLSKYSQNKFGAEFSLKGKYKILIIGFTESIHTARWVKNMAKNDYEIHLFSSSDSGVNNEVFRDLNIKIYHTFYSKLVGYFVSGKNGIKRLRLALSRPMMISGFREIIKRIFPNYHKKYLIHVIKKIKPDIIHSMEIQHGAYLVNEVKKNYKGNFPKWVATNWGSDIYLFGRLNEHRQKVKDVLQNCDYYSCECNRDVCLARNYGFKGKVLPVFPNTGGFEIKKISILRNKIKPSKRKIIFLKGYQGWSGRALVGLRALERCADILEGYQIYIYSIQPTSGVDIAAELFTLNTKIPVHIVPLFTSHQTILKYQSQARIYLGLGISDAISTSLLESMAMGSFPIQSNTSCANEWVKDGKSGFIVPPEDPEIIEKALRKALTDDKLVDSAAKINWQIVKNRLDEKILKKKVIDFYKTVGNK